MNSNRNLDGYVVPFKERMSFGMAGAGQNAIYSMMLTYLMFFYTDVLGVGAATIGTIFLLARIWDGVNDPIMGYLVDRTNTRWGKFRPYMLFATIPMGITTILCFTAPDVSSTMKVVYVTVTYILWGMSFTLSDVPLWSLCSAMTSNSDERNSLITLNRLCAQVGILIAALGFIPLSRLLGGGDTGQGYHNAAMVITIFSCLCMTMAFFGTRERVPVRKEKTSLRENLNCIVRNRPLLLVMASILLATPGTIASMTLIYFAKYNLGDELQVSPLLGLTFGGLLLGMSFNTSLVQRLGKRNTYLLFSFLRVGAGLVFLAGGYQNLTFVYVITFIAGFCTGPQYVLPTAFVADSIEYAEWKTGKRTPALIFSAQSFMFKVQSGLTGFFAGIALSVINYVPNAPQTPATESGLFYLVALMPIVGSFLGAIPFFFYRFNEKEHQEVVTKLAVRANTSTGS
jgi:sugar (glycoside-pentoside-hexuronide) transporter